ncbi:MAG: hypothetical protein C4326_03105 [Ignavibacteria bacterium]
MVHKRKPSGFLFVFVGAVACRCRLYGVYKRHPRFAFNVIATSRVLFCRNEGVLVDFKRNTLLFYFDTQRLRDMTDAALRRRMASGTFGKTSYVG